MNNDDPKLSITYSSDIICREPDILSTLAVFYDEIWLPYPYELDPNAIVIWEAPIKQKILISKQEEYVEWRNQWKLLFEQGILRVLPPPIQRGNYPANFDRSIYGRLKQYYSYPKYTDKRPDGVYTFDIVTGRAALAIHALYAPKPSPELFISNPKDTTTSRLAGFLVRSLFQYQVPQLSSLTAEQVLEIRNYLKDAKQGFIDYVFELADDVEARLKDGAKTEEEAALKTIERKFLPKYREIRRQLEVKETGFWSKVLAAGAKFFQIDAAPWTPKFYGGLFEALFGSLEEAAKAETEAQSNANQSFQYLAKLKSAVKE